MFLLPEKVEFKASLDQLRLSSPHRSFLRSVSRKLSSSNSTMEMVKSAFLMITVVLLLKVAILESKDTRKFFSLPLTCNDISVESGITSGLAFKLCGAIGVKIKLSASGMITGPPQLSEYPVEPVGVETIRPSAQ